MHDFSTLTPTSNFCAIAIKVIKLFYVFFKCFVTHATCSHCITKALCHVSNIQWNEWLMQPYLVVSAGRLCSLGSQTPPGTQTHTQAKLIQVLHTWFNPLKPRATTVALSTYGANQIITCACFQLESGVKTILFY